jgi:calcineurin-like phosphoesterase family protein
VIKSNKDLRDKFVSVDDYKEIEIDRIKVVLFHFPILEWNRGHRGAFHLFGHVHGDKDNHPVVTGQRMMDVGVDGRPDGQAPDDGPMSLWNWNQIKRILEKRPVFQHHGGHSEA